jgi:predicted GNAT family acetyltransferase
MADEPEVVHNPEARRFEIVVDEAMAVLDYALSNGRITFLHTGVPAALEGRGLGSRLAKAGLEYARRERLRVVAQCPFVRSYLERHPEYK